MANKMDCVFALVAAGISRSDAEGLRRIAMTLHRWHEMECGVSNGCITRDEETGKPYWQWSTLKAPMQPIADREKGALNRLAGIMAKYPAMTSYVQGDPRGCALYILRAGDIPNGADGKPGDVSAYYSRGLAVYK